MVAVIFLVVLTVVVEVQLGRRESFSQGWAGPGSPAGAAESGEASGTSNCSRGLSPSLPSC